MIYRVLPSEQILNLLRFIYEDRLVSPLNRSTNGCCFTDDLLSSRTAAREVYAITKIPRWHIDAMLKRMSSKREEIMLLMFTDE